MASTRPRSWCTTAREAAPEIQWLLPVARGDLAVQRHGPLGDDPRAARGDQLEVGRVQPPSFLARAGRLRPRCPAARSWRQAAARHARKRIGLARPPRGACRRRSRRRCTAASGRGGSTAPSVTYRVAPRGLGPAVRRASISACGPPKRPCQPSPITRSPWAMTQPTRGLGSTRPCPRSAKAKAPGHVLQIDLVGQTWVRDADQRQTSSAGRHEVA